MSAAGPSLGTLSNSGSIIGSSNGIYNNGGSITALTNDAGGTISANGAGIYNAASSTIGTLTNNAGGTIGGGTIGLNTSGTIGTLTNSGTLSGSIYGISNAGTIGTLTNSGALSAGYMGIANGGTIDALTNSGTLSGGQYGINNGNTIDTLTNSGTLSSGSIDIYNSGGTIDTLINSGTLNGGYVGINNGSTINSLNNSGSISVNDTGIGNSGIIGTLTNSGAIVGGYSAGISNNGSIGTLSNSGTISGSNSNSGSQGYGISNSGSIDSLSNSGTISGTVSGTGAGYGIYNSGSIGTLTNSGTITGTNYAIYNDTSGTLGPITHSGVIAGNIANLSSNDLRISGGTGTIFGTLTGYGGGSTIGTITNTASNVVFGSGNLLLNDNVNVGSNAVNNTGTAVLQVNQPVTITGNYNQGSGATLQIGVAGTSAGQYGQLVVTGDATIASGSSVTLQSHGYAFAAGQRYVVVDTAGTAVYNPGSLTYSINGYTATVTGTVTANGSKSDLVLDVVSATSNSTSTSTSGSTTGTGSTTSTGTTTTTGSNPASFATAQNAITSLTGLLGYTGISSPALLNLYNAALGSLSEGSAATANRIGKQLGATQTGSASASAAPTFDALNVVGAHVDSLRLAQAAGETGVASGEGPPKWGVWGQAFGGHASQNQRDDVDGYSANYAGLLLGVDRAINERWRAGGVFSYSNTAINNTGDTAGDTARVNGYGLIGYASYTGSPWYVNLSGAVVQQQYDTTRVVSMQGFSGVARGHFDGQQYVARAEAGYPLALRGVTLTPLASLTYSYLNQGGYTETGGNGAALSVGSSHASSVKSSLGAKLEKGFTTRYGEIVPQLQAKWIHEYNHTRQVTGASFAADPTGQTAFTTVGAAPVADLADLSLGVTLLRANNLSLSVRYELQAAPGFVSQTGTVRLRQLF